MVRPKNEVWNYFDNIVEEGTAVCRACHHRLRNNRSYNLRQHLRKVHNMEFEDINSNQTPSSPQPYDDAQINAVLRVAKRKMQEERHHQGEKRTRKRIYIEMEKKTFLRSILGLMVDDGLGPEIFDSVNFSSLIKPICEAISEQEGKQFAINAAKAERALSLLADNMRNDFSNDLHWRLLSLKIDTDLNAPPNTFSVSAQFVNEGQVESHLLGVINLAKEETRFTEGHITEILHKFNIDTNQIIAACWDNTKERLKQQVTNSEYQQQIEDFENYPNIRVGDIKVEPHIGAIAQLCLLDILKTSHIFQPFLECRNLTSYLNDNCNGYYEIFEEKKLRIPSIDSPWKYGSSYNMINDLLLARPALENVKFEKLDSAEEGFVINDNLWSFMEAFIKILNCLQKSILRFYEEVQHFGDFYAQWLKTKLLTEKLANAYKHESNYTSLISQELLQSIEKRSTELMRHHRFEACLYLDPRFQHTLNLQRKANALEYLKNLWTRAKIFNADVVKPATEATSMQNQEFDDDEDAYLNEFLSQDIPIKHAATADVYARMESLKLPFQMVDTNILFFWRELKFSEPEMHALSSICFAMPATQIYNKLNYSHIFQITDSSKQTQHTKDNLLFIRLNSHLLENAIDQVEIFKDNAPAEAQTESEPKNNGIPVISTVSISPASTTITVKQEQCTESPLEIIATTSTTTVPKTILTRSGTAVLPPNIIIKPIT